MAEKVQDAVTIGDVIRLALPLSVTVVGSENCRHSLVNWVSFLSGWGRIEADVRMGDLVLLPASVSAKTDPSILQQGVAKLVEVGIAGIITFGQFPKSGMVVAKKHDLPVLLMPASHSLRDIHQVISSLLIDRQKQTTERGLQLYRRLSELSREGQGLYAMTKIMAQLAGKMVVVQDKRLEIQAISQPPNSPIKKEFVVQLLAQQEQLPFALRNRKKVAKIKQTHWQQVLPIQEGEVALARLVAPIVSGDRARGYVSVVGLADELDLLDTLTVEHGAAACALEMAKAKAISEVKKGLRGDFLEGLLMGNLPREEIERLASRLDHDTKHDHVVLVLKWAENAGIVPTLRRLETAVNWLATTHIRPALIHRFGETHLCMFQSIGQEVGQDMPAVFELAERIRKHVETEEKGAQLMVGVSGVAHTIYDWAENHQQAMQAMRLAQRLGLDYTVDYNSLGIYQLLTKLEDLPAVQQFTEQMVSPLVAYDQKHRSSLVKTILAYFDHHGNISQTAESLFVHRNTLLYRLERIQELTKQNLNQADMRLALHLSLKLWQLRKGQNDSPIS